VPFEEELREICQADDSIEPEVLRSAKSVKYLKKPPIEIISPHRQGLKYYWHEDKYQKFSFKKEV